MGPQSQLLTEAERFSTQLIATRVSRDRWFHSLEHTRGVARNSFRLAQMASCSYAELEMLLVAAWFHDTGYIVGSVGHEQERARIAIAFLRPFNRSSEFIGGIRDLILATRVPPSPFNLLEEIICDADMAHLGSVEYWHCEALLRRELESAEGVVLSDEDWARKNISFFQQHSYYTKYARELWDEGKLLNLSRLMNIQ
ncbi:MAG TPA: HD domain-containing protein [Chryseolinea sp.]|nr:HD domain-containing protein [Chryseolinea sp.]